MLNLPAFIATAMRSGSAVGSSAMDASFLVFVILIHVIDSPFHIRN